MSGLTPQYLNTHEDIPILDSLHEHFNTKNRDCPRWRNPRSKVVPSTSSPKYRQKATSNWYTGGMIDVKWNFCRAADAAISKA